MTTKLTFIPNIHPDEDVFEKYTFGRLSEAAVASFEEHLLICETCQDRLNETTEYILAMKVCVAHFEPARLRKHGLRRNAVAAAILLLTCLTALLSWRTPPGEAKPVVLEALRGTASTAPSGQALELKIDLKDLPPGDDYRVEVVDATGRRVWFGGTPARLTEGLAPGQYWVRLSTPNGEQLREYGLSAAKSR